jgi:hypothetical protein
VPTTARPEALANEGTIAEATRLPERMPKLRLLIFVMLIPLLIVDEFIPEVLRLVQE